MQTKCSRKWPRLALRFTQRLLWDLGLRIAFTTPSATVVAHKLTRADLGAMLTGLRRAAPWAGERLFCEEPSAPAREFGSGDWVCVDVDPETGSLRLGQDGSPLVRTVYEAAFESSYNSIF